VPYDPTIYQGAAAHSRNGRPAYSPELESVLTEELDLDGSGRLLDAGCGPGILTVRLAHLFEAAVGLDPDPEMLAEGRRVADERGITNIRWVQALAEELPDAAPGPYRLVTFGQSFHWTDEARVAESVYDMLEPDGALALIVHTVEGRRAPPRRDSESVLSGYFSMSSSAPHLFGDRVEDFADEVRELLASRSMDGVFWDWPGDTEVVLARRSG
jgi:ubiquinone/menaquinone biosynthesis C-methylase UbiE